MLLAGFLAQNTHNTFHFPVSTFPPLALGFFGLGVGYLIYGPQELFGFPRRDLEIDRTTGLWGIWMPGFLQFIAGIIIFVGLTWFRVFTEHPLYMAALAFTAYGVHWFAIGRGRFLGSDPRPNGLMSFPFTLLSILGMWVFFDAGDWPVGIVFAGLTAVYISDFFASLRVGRPFSERALGLFHILTGLWLMYMTFAVALNFAIEYHLPI